MLRNDRRVAIGCWLAAGFPIAISFLQSVIALLGADADSLPILGTIKQSFDTIAVLDAAGDIFRNNDVIVFALFILIALSWLGIGITMILLEERQFSYATAGFVTLFLILFFLVYTPLFQEDIPISQLITFVSIPIFTVGAVWLSVTSYEWESALEDETTNLLAESSDTATQARLQFEEKIAEEADAKTRELLLPVAADAVSEFEDTITEFKSECDRIEQDCEELLDGTSMTGTESRNQQAKSLQAEANKLDPQSRAQTALATFRTALAQELESEFGDFELKSRYGVIYKIRNLGAYNELNLPDEPTVQIGGDAHELGNYFRQRIEIGTPLPDVARAVDQTKQHTEELRETIQREEQRFDDQLSIIRDNFSEANDAVSRMEQSSGDRLAEILFEKRFGSGEPPFPTKIDVDNKTDGAKQALHDCRFERAHRRITDAAESSDVIKRIALFFSDSIIPTIKHGSGSIPIPDYVGTEVVEKMKPEIEQVYDVKYNLEDGELKIKAPEGSAQMNTPEQHDRPHKAHSQEDVSQEDVLYLLRELRRSASESDKMDTVVLQLGEYPEKFSNEKFLEEIEAFCSRQSQISEISIPDVDPGYVELTVNEESNTYQAIADVCKRYQAQFG